MDNVNITVSKALDATRDFRAMFYLVTPSEAIFEHVKDVPNYTQKVEHYICAYNLLSAASCSPCRTF